MDLGPAYTHGSSFRARAEARQREYRASVLEIGYTKLGHMLDDESAAAGRNFVIPEAYDAARARAASGKGVDEKRTFSNMLSSQAMCFNVFTPLATDHDLAGMVLRRFVPGLERVRAIHFEYTPPRDVFRDQTGRGGVDCDLLIEADWKDGERGVVAVETKFVETEFSSCGFRESGRAAKGRPVCPAGVPVRADPSACLYSALKRYKYWDRTLERGNIVQEQLPEAGCPFGGPLWQLWVNHTLAHVEAARRNARHARFAVCAPRRNEALLRGGVVLDEFRNLLADAATLLFIDVDELVQAIAFGASTDDRKRSWSKGIASRYGNI